jgi:hypothetical protein
VIRDRRAVLSGDYPIAGMIVHKIGQTTGHTSGLVQYTCLDLVQYSYPEGFDTGRTLLCQAVAGFATDAGDSGAPVAFLNSDGSLTDMGISWGGGAFSKWASYRFEAASTYHGGCCFDSFQWPPR